jgi:hypothetical protein
METEWFWDVFVFQLKSFCFVSHTLRRVDF